MALNVPVERHQVPSSAAYNYKSNRPKIYGAIRALTTSAKAPTRPPKENAWMKPGAIQANFLFLYGTYRDWRK